MPCPYDPALDPDPDKVSPTRRLALHILGWDLYLNALILGMAPGPGTLTSTYRQDDHRF